MVNYTVYTIQQLRRFRTNWQIESLQKAIDRNPNSEHNAARQQVINTLKDKLNSED